MIGDMDSDAKSQINAARIAHFCGTVVAWTMIAVGFTMAFLPLAIVLLCAVLAVILMLFAGLFYLPPPLALAISTIVGAATIWIIVRRVNRRRVKLPPDAP